MSNRPHDPSRREFVTAGAAALIAAGLSAEASAEAEASAWPTANSAAELTAQQVIDRIRAKVGVPWRETTVDTFKAGDPQTIVTGIATTAMATLPVLRQAAAAGRNLIVTCEPTFYNGNDDPGPRSSDPIYLAKKAFIDERRLVIWRFQDHWGARTPNEFATALADTLGWAKLRTPENPLIYAIPSTTVGALAAHVRARLGAGGPGRRSLGEGGGMRVIGNAGMPVRRVFVSPGTTSLQATIDNLPKADLVLSGEPREWEAVEYVFDTASAGQPKGMIAVGRVVSEEPGMRACAAWLRSLITEVPIEPIAVGDPYWRPV
jgi:putative NIF3 family GTP cyclohydrolase 1 type 2